MLTLKSGTNCFYLNESQFAKSCASFKYVDDTVEIMLLGNERRLANVTKFNNVTLDGTTAANIAAVKTWADANAF
jgi:hypothetical protein